MTPLLWAIEVSLAFPKSHHCYCKQKQFQVLELPTSVTITNRKFKLSSSHPFNKFHNSFFNSINILSLINSAEVILYHWLPNYL